MTASGLSDSVTGSRPAGGARRPSRRSDRLAAIVDALADHGAVHVAELALRFGVSEATLRRDLTLLEERRVLTRTHGGALAQDAGYQLPARRAGDGRDAARAVAAAAVLTLAPGPHVVGLTGGAAPLELARLLASRDGLTVVTNALDVAAELVLRPVTLVVVGGVWQPGAGELVGPWAEEVLSSVNVGTAFVGADALSAGHGLTADDEIGARTQQALIARASRVVALAPGAAIGRVALARIAGAEALHGVITDADAPPAALAALRAAGVPVTVADPPDPGAVRVP